MTYEELNRLNKYMYNQVDYNDFCKGLEAVVPNVEKGYADEKWDIFRKSPIQFTATYHRRFCDYFIYKMNKENYKG